MAEIIKTKDIETELKSELGFYFGLSLMDKTGTPELMKLTNWKMAN